MIKDEIFGDNKKIRILARVVAHYMGDGCVTNRYAAYFNKNETLLKNFEKDILSLFEGVHIIRGKCNSGTKLIQIQNKQIIKFLKELVSDYRSSALKFPRFINHKDLEREFLRAIYDDEGCVALRTFKKTNDIKRNITLSSNSKEFLEKIKEILKNDFDITSNKLTLNKRSRGVKEYINYVLSISGRSNFIKFKELIGFNHPDKINKLELMINSYIRLASCN